jgi:hypothetical protein
MGSALQPRVIIAWQETKIQWLLSKPSMKAPGGYCSLGTCEILFLAIFPVSSSCSDIRVCLINELRFFGARPN